METDKHIDCECNNSKREHYYKCPKCGLLYIDKELGDRHNKMLTDMSKLVWGTKTIEQFRLEWQ